MRLFIDECLSPRIADWLNHSGEHDAVHPLHVGRRGEPDHRVLARCIREDRVLVTQNARDFRRLVGRTERHSGLIILPPIDRDGSYRLLLRAIEELSGRGEPQRVMVNRALEVTTDGGCVLYDLVGKRMR